MRAFFVDAHGRVAGRAYAARRYAIRPMPALNLTSPGKSTASYRTAATASGRFNVSAIARNNSDSCGSIRPSAPTSDAHAVSTRARTRGVT